MKVVPKNDILSAGPLRSFVSIGGDLALAAAARAHMVGREQRSGKRSNRPCNASPEENSPGYRFASSVSVFISFCNEIPGIVARHHAPHTAASLFRLAQLRRNIV